ncbi:hypothetical protein E2C01_041995 [Portunus trituberculatus]|uniref:Uncharacterized protein n=1 Tax=Portunus trituberculatus TaxID=210409 RepID=A0A5B7FS74_PORTR|nr:hypothetical protein [Portunus trituberculatus]
MSSSHKQDEKAIKKIIQNNVKPTEEDPTLKLVIYYKTKRTSSLSPQLQIYWIHYHNIITKNYCSPARRRNKTTPHRSTRHGTNKKRTRRGNRNPAKRTRQKTHKDGRTSLHTHAETFHQHPTSPRIKTPDAPPIAQQHELSPTHPRVRLCHFRVRTCHSRVHTGV